MSELRRNSMLGEWVIVTPKRGSRPFQDKDRSCPFCPGQDETQGEWEVLTLENKYAALQPDEFPISLDSDLVIGTNAHGYCKVIVESRDHNQQIEDMSPEQLERVSQEYLKVFKELDAKIGIKYVFEFENRGKAIGVSLNHPHGQVYALPFIPPRIQRELEQFKHYNEVHGECLICDSIENELKTKERVIFESDKFISLIPYGARLPYEVHIYPKEHVYSLEGLSGSLREFGQVIADTIKRFDSIFDEIAYTMVFHTRPSGANYDEWHFHVEFYPPWRDKNRIKYLAGVESGTWTYTNDSSPEEKAQELRNAI